MPKLTGIYAKLLKLYGPQGWWPLLDVEGKNPTKTGSMKGYHPKDYSYPKTDKQRFEICIGTILAQNTSWVQVEKALQNLKKINYVDPKKILKINESNLGKAIKPAGYFNQKAKKLKRFSEFYISLKGKVPSREELLNMWGIGPETADSILLYAYKKPYFVIDAYTKRIFSRLGFFSEKAKYDEMQKFFMDNFPKDYKKYNEFHALIVEHAKRCCNKTNPLSEKCILKKACKFKNI